MKGTLKMPTKKFLKRNRGVFKMGKGMVKNFAKTKPGKKKKVKKESMEEYQAKRMKQMRRGY